MCSFVFKKRGLAAGRGRRKRPSSDQEQGERRRGCRGRYALRRPITVPEGGEGRPAAAQGRTAPQPGPALGRWAVWVRGDAAAGPPRRGAVRYPPAEPRGSTARSAPRFGPPGAP